ncbi:MAG: hypothetical protein ACRBFS_17175 [Aureispira sp.]
MATSLMRFLGFISCCFLVIACQTPKALQPLKEGQHLVISKKDFKPVFKNKATSFLFKTTLNFGPNIQQGGLLALKKSSDQHYRAIFMTKFGLTLFDFEFGEQGFIVHKALEQVNKPILLQVIRQDLELLLARHIIGQSAQVFEQGHSLNKKRILKWKQGGKSLFYVQGLHQKLTAIYRARAVQIKLSKYILGVPHSIDIQHHNVPLRLQLSFLK